ncbi:MAG: tRNA (adenosine(37)-N6)-dimethylallyltransferase MiaA [Caldilineaceae bacterium]|nr:tRNA (adenosine(37)-N6)-dimethylallyltransferase MiaA [Caldilineaceae bacterium]
MPPLIVLLGPTAVGKTALSLDLCQAFAGEIISVDSRQIYRGMDIGTAKATPAEQARAPHHLIDIRDPDETLTLAEYQALAYAAIDAIHGRGHVPFLVGGTALYIRAVVRGLRIPNVPPNPALRAELENFLDTQGREVLFARLAALDPATAAVIDAQNPRRVLRALEIFLTTGRPKVELEGEDPPPYRTLMLGLRRARAELHARVDARVDAMVRDGLIDETRRLLAAYDPALPALTSLGYKEIGAFLRGEMDLPAAVAQIKVETHRYVRHQTTWFRKMPEILWFDPDDATLALIRQAVAAFLSQSDAPG